MQRVSPAGIRLWDYSHMEGNSHRGEQKMMVKAGC